MSDGIRDFFKQHHAVRAGDTGPDWATASDDSLLGWIRGEFDLIRRKTGDPKRVLLMGALTEAWNRIGRLTLEAGEHGKDWPGRDRVGRLLAILAVNADLLALTVK